MNQPGNTLDPVRTWVAIHVRRRSRAATAASATVTCSGQKASGGSTRTPPSGVHADRRDVRRRVARAAAAVAAPTGDGRRRRAQRLPHRPVASAPAHRRLPGGDHVQSHGRGGAGSCASAPCTSARRRRRAGRPPLRRQRSAPVAMGARRRGRQLPRRASALRRDAAARPRSATSTCARWPSSRALGVPAPPESERPARPDPPSAPSSRARPPPARRRATCSCNRRCTLPSVPCTRCSARPRWRCCRVGRAGRCACRRCRCWKRWRCGRQATLVRGLRWALHEHADPRRRWRGGRRGGRRLTKRQRARSSERRGRGRRGR